MKVDPIPYGLVDNATILSVNSRRRPVDRDYVLSGNIASAGYLVGIIRTKDSACVVPIPYCRIDR